MAQPHALIFEENLRIPAEAFTYEGFQEWLVSGEFPDSGRIDFLAGDVAVETSPEALHTDNAVKVGVGTSLYRVVADQEKGDVFVGRAHFRSRMAELSVEPDAVVVLWDSLRSGRASYVSKTTKRGGRFSVIEGAPDVIVEVVSESSVGKDTRRLPLLYARAGVSEFWLVDVRGQEPRFEIRDLRDDEYVVVAPDAEGWARSPRLGLSFRLTRHRTPPGHWRYVLEHRETE